MIFFVRLAGHVCAVRIDQAYLGNGGHVFFMNRPSLATDFYPAANDAP